MSRTLRFFFPVLAGVLAVLALYYGFHRNTERVQSVEPAKWPGPSMVAAATLKLGEALPTSKPEASPQTKSPVTTPQTKPPVTTPQTKPPVTTPQTKPPVTTPQTKPPETPPPPPRKKGCSPRPAITKIDIAKLSQGVPVVPKCTVQVSNPPNPKPYLKKEKCCSFAEGKNLPKLCGEVNATTLGDGKASGLPECSCVDFMACKLIIASGVSSDHFNEGQDAIASAQNFHPDVSIQVYDLGLKECEIDHLNNLHNVQVTTFPFSEYPPHFRNLQTYAWKPYSINRTLTDHEIVFWMDSSIRLKAPLTDKFLPDIQVFPYRGSIDPLSYDGMYSYDSMYEWFGTSRAEMGKNGQIEGGYGVYRRTPYLYENILNDVLRCVADPKCVTPPGHYLYCGEIPAGKVPNAETKPEDVPNRHCSRYDQSALTISIHMHHPHVTGQTRFVSSVIYTMGVYRNPTNCFTLYERD